MDCDLLAWHSQKVLGVCATGMPYVVFVIVGTVLWQTFVETLKTSPDTPAHYCEKLYFQLLKGCAGVR